MGDIWDGFSYFRNINRYGIRLFNRHANAEFSDVFHHRKSKTAIGYQHISNTIKNCISIPATLQ